MATTEYCGIPTSTAALGSDSGASVPWWALFSTEGFPRRWSCGDWPNALGWLHITSDIITWAAYTTIPLMLAFYLLQRKRNTTFPAVGWLFVAFIFLCGSVHLLEAIIFWNPLYRLSALLKASTAVVSVATAAAMFPLLPKALALPGPARDGRRIVAVGEERHLFGRFLRRGEAEAGDAAKRHLRAGDETEMAARRRPFVGDFGARRLEELRQRLEGREPELRPLRPEPDDEGRGHGRKPQTEAL